MEAKSNLDASINEADCNSSLHDVAYVIPLQAFVYRQEGTWRLDTPVGREAIHAYLVNRGWDIQTATAVLKERKYLKVNDIMMAPNRPSLFRERDGSVYINTWIPPTLKPAKGPYPRIGRVLDWLTRGDAEGKRWLLNWMALKVQNPDIVPKVAVVFTTEQGGGKGTLARLMMLMLGPENCAVISRGALESRFNSRWLPKLFVLADEVLSSENLKDLSDYLKLLIDAPTIELEGKGRDQRSIRNRLAWMFASNDRVTPVRVEKGDRRYTVFSNHDPLPPDYEAVVKAVAYEAEQPEPAAWFVAEVQGFLHDLLTMEVDRQFASRPYQNEERRQLIEASLSAHELFCQHVDEHGIDGLLEEVMNHSDWTFSSKRHQWDFSTNGVSTQILYECYLAFCRRTGTKQPLRYNKFGQALRNHRGLNGETWDFRRNSVPGGDQRVNCYVVRRVKPPEKGLRAVPAQEQTADRAESKSVSV